MTRTIKLLSAVSALTVAMIGVSPAYAAGTAAGDIITNNVTVNFQVGGISQTASTDSDAFTVDRKVNLLVTETNTTTVSVSPGQANVVAAFTVTNTSNATIDIGLAATQPTGGAAAHTGTDNFDVTGLTLYRDEGNGTYDGTETVISYADELAADTAITVFAVGTVPISQATNDVAAVILTGTAREGGTASSQGAIITATAGGNTAGVDTVLADSAGETGDAAYDGKHSDMDDFTVLAAAVTANKYSTIISDPVNGTGANRKPIPGAVVEYCIAVYNAGGASATGVTVSDTVPATTLLDTAYGAYEQTTVSGTGASATCSLDGTQNTGATVGDTVTGNLGSIAPNSGKGVRFRVTIR